MNLRQNKLPVVTVKYGTEFYVSFPSGNRIILTHEEWLAFRIVQNALIHTEPTILKEKAALETQPVKQPEGWTGKQP